MTRKFYYNGLRRCSKKSAEKLKVLIAMIITFYHHASL